MLSLVWRTLNPRRAPDESVPTLKEWLTPFHAVGFNNVSVAREQRDGYVDAQWKNAYYKLIKRLPDVFILSHGLTSATITATVKEIKVQPKKAISSNLR